MSARADVFVALEAAKTGRTVILHQLFARNTVSVNLLESGSERQLLYLAARNGHLETVAMILKQQNLRIDAVSRLGWTALHTAAQWGYKDIVLLLLKAGADPNVGNGHRHPIHSVVFWSRFDIIDILVDNGVDVDQMDCNSHTPLWYAFTEANLRATVKLLECGANPILVDQFRNEMNKLGAEDCKAIFLPNPNGDERRQRQRKIIALMHNKWREQEHRHLVETSILLKPLSLPALIIYRVYLASTSTVTHKKLIPAVSRHKAWKIIVAIKQ